MTLTRFSRFAWSVLAFNVGVIAWGAVVRATGSGAGCGSHWPECDGAVVPALADAETAIEFAHRLTSGLAFLAVIALFVLARRMYPSGHRVRLGASGALAFIAIEVLIGAALVTFGWVDDDTSAGRVVAIAVHLANTFVLLGWLALTAWWASGRPRVRLDDRRAALAFGAGLAALLVVGAIGAITALGDTLFPDASIADDFSRSAHYTVRLRALHPVLAVLTGAYLVLVARRYRGAASAETRRLAAALPALVAIQIAAGFVNLFLAAPLWLQLVHLLLADGLWIVTVLLGASVLAEAPAQVALAEEAAA